MGNGKKSQNVLAKQLFHCKNIVRSFITCENIGHFLRIDKKEMGIFVDRKGGSTNTIIS
jgi:hypothetical protein